MAEQPVAEAVASMLAGQGLTLGTVECGTGGIVSHRLFETEDGPAVLGDSLMVDTVEEVIDILGLPEPQFKSAGTFSAKAARAAARAGREMLEVDWCLAVWAQPLPAEAATVQETVHLALDRGGEVADRTAMYYGSTHGIAGWIAEQALELVQHSLAAQHLDGKE
jgi:nicotinamide mononucleotide (NMN) deamidase PncC